jgi:DNA-binding winged helix-turn-helix (wHTH) protein
MLSHLIRNRGRVVLRDELLQAVWGTAQCLNRRTVDVHMWQLRQKLEVDPQSPQFLRTIRGTGYLFRGLRVPQVTENERISGGLQDARIRAAIPSLIPQVFVVNSPSDHGQGTAS